jgi:hypothetical protein
MVYFMGEANVWLISQRRKHQEKREKEQERKRESDRERETLFRVASAREFFSP